MVVNCVIGTVYGLPLAMQVPLNLYSIMQQILLRDTYPIIVEFIGHDPNYISFYFYWPPPQLLVSFKGHYVT